MKTTQSLALTILVGASGFSAAAAAELPSAVNTRPATQKIVIHPRAGNQSGAATFGVQYDLTSGQAQLLYRERVFPSYKSALPTSSALPGSGSEAAERHNAAAMRRYQRECERAKTLPSPSLTPSLYPSPGQQVIDEAK